MRWTHALALLLVVGGGLLTAWVVSGAPVESDAPVAPVASDVPAAGQQPPQKPTHPPALLMPAPVPNREVPLPTVEPRVPERAKSVAHPLAASKSLAQARDQLHKVVVDHGRDPENPWAVGHAMLALGPDVELTNGVPASDHLFAVYAEWVDVADTPGIAFPRRRGSVRIEPHSDLLLKALTEGGVLPDRAISVAGKPSTPLALYRHSMHRAWLADGKTGFDSLNDTPWALQSIASWAPPKLSWKAIGRHEMTLDGMTADLLSVLEREGAQLSKAKAAGAMPQKDGKGILSYTCGGQHLIQGVAHAVARGFGPEDGAARICAQRDLLLWRIDHELGTIDPIITSERGKKDRALVIVLLDQRLKFLGHALETTSKIDAYDMCEWGQSDDDARDRLGAEIVRTVQALEDLKVFSSLSSLRTDDSFKAYRPKSGGEQVYLDVVGDAAHAVRGIDLALGTGSVRF